MRRVAAVCRFDQAEQRFAVAPEAESPTHDLLVHGHAGLATHGWGKVGSAWSAAGRRGARMSVVGHAGVSADSAEKRCGTCQSRRLPGTRRARMWTCQATNGRPPGTYPCHAQNPTRTLLFPPLPCPESAGWGKGVASVGMS